MGGSAGPGEGFSGKGLGEFERVLPCTLVDAGVICPMNVFVLLYIF